MTVIASDTLITHIKGRETQSSWSSSSDITIYGLLSRSIATQEIIRKKNYVTDVSIGIRLLKFVRIGLLVSHYVFTCYNTEKHTVSLQRVFTIRTYNVDSFFLFTFRYYLVQNTDTLEKRDFYFY